MKDDGSQFLFQVWPLPPAASLLPLPAVAAAATAAPAAAAPCCPTICKYGWSRAAL
jgi:hypothetical protein